MGRRERHRQRRRVARGAGRSISRLLCTLTMFPFLVQGRDKGKPVEGPLCGIWQDRVHVPHREDTETGGHGPPRVLARQALAAFLR